MVKKKKPNMKYFHVFGCKCFILKTHPEQLSKFDLKADEGIFVGYPLSTKAFRVYNLRTRVVMESINVSFDDKKITGLEDFNDHDPLRFENKDLNSDSINSEDLYSDPISTDVTESVVTTPKENAPVQGEQAEDSTTSQDSQEASEPVTGFSSSDSSSSDEPNSDNSEHSDTSNPEGSKSNSEVSECITTGGASENAHGDSMNHGGGSSSRSQLQSARNWTKSYTPDLIIGDPEAGVRTRIVTSNECHYHSFPSQTKPKKVEEALQDADWVNKTDSDVIITRNKARLDKELYGLKQAPRAWYETLAQFLLESGFYRGTIDKTLFYLNHGNDLLLVQIYVDDIIFGSINAKLFERFAKLMQSRYQMSMMGELSYFMGLQVKQNEEGTFICQSKYTKNLLKKFGMQDCSTASTPMATATKLDKDTSSPVDITNYRGMIGSLLCLTASRTDIMYDTCLCARFQADPREPHLIAVKIIFKYLKGTADLGLWYPRESDFKLIGDPVQHSMTKHISIRYHFKREHMMEGTVELHFVPTDQQLADIFTKPLCQATFIRSVNELGMVSVNLKDELNTDKPHLSKEKKRKEKKSQLHLDRLEEERREALLQQERIIQPVIVGAENVTFPKGTAAQSSDTLKRKYISSEAAKETPSLARRLKKMRAERYKAKPISEDSTEAEEGDQESLISSEPVVNEALPFPTQAQDTVSTPPISPIKATDDAEEQAKTSEIDIHNLNISNVLYLEARSTEARVSVETPVPILGKEKLVKKFVEKEAPIPGEDTHRGVEWTKKWNDTDFIPSSNVLIEHIAKADKLLTNADLKIQLKITAVVFAGFSAESVAQRISDCKPKVLITCNIVMRGSKLIRLKQIVDAALTESSKNGFSLGMKVYSTEEKELIMEPTLKWAGNPNILVAAKAYRLKTTVQVVDLQVFASPRITLKPLVPSFPCFAKILVSLMEKPHVDFGLKLLEADAMSIPGLYSFVQLGYVYRENSRIPNYYDGRYWTMWKLPMFGCTDASQVLHEIAECKKAYPSAYIRCLDFDNIRQAQCMSFIIQKPTTTS
ncbi:hypothetical protein AgCh_000661 [Apium graveolens]